VQQPHQLVRTEPQAHCIVPDPTNRYAFVTSLAGDMVLRHVFDAAIGRFSPNPLPPVRTKPNAGPRHLVFHPNNRFLYLINELDGSVYAYAYDAAVGALHEIQALSALPPDFGDKRPLASDIHVTPDGRFLYASERTSSTIAAFRIDAASGRLTPAGSFPTEEAPRGFNIDPYGRYMLVVGRKSNRMTCYAIDRESGGLTALKTYPMGDDPNWIEIVRLP
jgi:6-phosphogluconolactonase